MFEKSGSCDQLLFKKTTIPMREPLSNWALEFPNLSIDLLLSISHDSSMYTLSMNIMKQNKLVYNKINKIEIKIPKLISSLFTE